MMGGVGGSEFIGSSARNGASIDTQGRAFGMNLNGGSNGNVPVIGAARLFSGLNGYGFASLSPGQTLRIDMENGTLAGGVHLGWGIYGSAGTGELVDFQLFADTNPATTHGKADYFIHDNAAGDRDTGVPVTDQGVHCEFTALYQYTDLSEDYALAITPKVAGAATTVLYGKTLFGGVNNELFLFDDNGDPSAPPDTAAGYLYFNNMAIVPAVPEPSSLLVLSIGVLPLIRGRRR